MKRICIILLCVCLILSAVGCTAQPQTQQPAQDRHFQLGTLTPEELAEAAASQSQYSSWFGGYVGDRVYGAIKNWLYYAYESNPMMLDAIRQRDKTNAAQELEFWFGMFAPCILRAGAYCYRFEKDPVLYEKMELIVQQSLDCWDAYGDLQYDINPEEFTVLNPSWLNGVAAWYGASGSEKSRELAIRLGDYLIERTDILGASDTEPTIGVAQLYLMTKEERFLELLDKYVMATSWSGANYVDAMEMGIEYYETGRHNWANVFEVQALGYLHDIYGDQVYYDALEYMFKGIVLTDRRSTGANTTAENACGTPYGTGSAETCGNVAWLACISEYLLRSKNSYAADEAELTLLNCVLGSQAATGHWWTYDTPQEGHRLASIDELAWQSYQGCPEFSCCTSNCALGVGTLSQWALLRDSAGIYVNYYGESEFIIATPGGKEMILRQDTVYPANGSIRLSLNLAESEEFTLNLRIPVWSKATGLSLNGKKLEAPVSGGYYGITRTWKDGDVLQLELDMSPHFWAAEGDYAGHISVYSGPVLLTLDKRFNENWDLSRQSISLEKLELTAVECATYPKTQLLYEVTDGSGGKWILCDFATAGLSGTYYTTWFVNTQLAPQPLERDVCSWNQRN